MAANEEKLPHDKILHFLEKFKLLNFRSSTKEIQSILYESVGDYAPYKDTNVIDIKK